MVGQAREWGTAMWDNEQNCCSSFESFSEELPSYGRCEFQASLLFNGAIYQVLALIDSGAEGNFIDSELATSLKAIEMYINDSQVAGII